MDQTARSLMREIVVVPPATTVAKAARLMKQDGIGSVLVGDKDDPKGIFTERDIVRRVVADGLDPETTLVSAVMTKQLTCVETTESWSRLLEILVRSRFRHLPVREGGRIVGIVSMSDLASLIAGPGRKTED